MIGSIKTIKWITILVVLLALFASCGLEERTPSITEHPGFLLYPVDGSERYDSIEITTPEVKHKAVGCVLTNLDEGNLLVGNNIILQIQFDDGWHTLIRLEQLEGVFLDTPADSNVVGNGDKYVLNCNLSDYGATILSSGNYRMLVELRQEGKNQSSYLPIPFVVK